MSKQAFAVIGAASVAGGLLVFVAQPGEHRPATRAAAISAAVQASDGVAPLETRANRSDPRPRSNFVDRSRGHVTAKPGVDVPLDETAVLEKLRHMAGEDPPLSMSLAREALARNPEGPHAPELEWNVVKALYNMGRFEEAKQEARTMVEAFPESSFTGDVVRHLLHPLPNPE